MNTLLNSISPNLEVLMFGELEIGRNELFFDEREPLERKGCCLGFNASRDQLAYIPTSRLQRYFTNKDGQYCRLFDPEHRKNTAVQSTVKKCLRACGITLPDEAIDRLQKYFKTPVLHFDILENGIDSVYAKWNDGLRGSLRASCMQGKSADFFTFYEQETCCKLLVAFDENNEFVGRALLWQSADGHILCDRRYGNSYYIEEALAEYAIAQGFYIKKNNNYERVEEWQGKNDTINQFQKVLLANYLTDHRCVPFCDTFQWVKNKTLYCYEIDEADYRLNTTDGDLRQEYIQCAACDDSYPVEDMYYDDEYYCTHCAFRCEDCDDICLESHGYTVASGSRVCESCLDQYSCCSECEESYPDAEVKYLANTEVSLCEDCRR